MRRLATSSQPTPPRCLMLSMAPDIYKKTLPMYGYYGHTAAYMVYVSLMLDIYASSMTSATYMVFSGIYRHI